MEPYKDMLMMLLVIAVVYLLGRME